MSQLLFVIGVGGIQVRPRLTLTKLVMTKDLIKRDADLSTVYLYTGHRALFITIISAVVYEISVVVLDLLLLSSFINYIP